MQTRKLLLLLTLVAVLGGSAVWYMETQLGFNHSPPVPAVTPDEVFEIEESEDADEESDPASAPATPAGASPAAGGSIDADVAALEGVYDASYDDSQLDAAFTSEGGNTMTDSYDF